MPRMATNSAMMASSSILSNDWLFKLPESKCSAKSTKYSTLRALKPAARMSSTFSFSTFFGSIFFGNSLEHVSNAYKRFLEGRYRQAFKLVGTPLRIEFKTTENPYKDK